MIFDGRYFARMMADNSMWRYDTQRGKTTQVKNVVDPVENPGTLVVEGTSAFLFVDQTDDETHLRVVLPADKQGNIEQVATAFRSNNATTWQFSGSKQAWKHVPEYVIIERRNADATKADEKLMLRIANEAQPLSLEETPWVHSAVSVPESRLVLLLGFKGQMAVIDPTTGTSSAHQSLAMKTDNPIARFRVPVVDEAKKMGEASETTALGTNVQLWINDGCLLMHLETRNWNVVDAAGTEDETDIETWAFVGDHQIAVVPKGKQEVMLIDVEEMSLVESFATKKPLIDIFSAQHDGLNLIVGVDETGKSMVLKSSK